MVGQYTRKRTTIPKNLRMGTVEALDGRYVVVKLLKGRWTQLTNDLGGAAELSYQEQSICWRLVALESWIEEQERRLLAKEPINEMQWLSALNCMIGLVNRIGIKSDGQHRSKAWTNT